jgi:ferritin-like metal-binding protein YciE
MISLRKAIQTGNLKQFIQEREKEAPVDLEKLNSVLKRPASGKPSKTPEVSFWHKSDD